MTDQFPGNSHNQALHASTTPRVEKSGPANHPEKKIEPIQGLGRVSQRKKSFGRRFSETFFGSALNETTSYIIRDVLVPAFQNLLIDTATQGLEKMFFGEVRSPNRSRFGVGSRDTNRTHISYDRPSSIRQTSATSSMLSDRGRDVRRERRHMPSSEVRDVFCETRIDADLILERLGDVIEKYEWATVADLKTMMDESPSTTDNNWGWDDVSHARIERTRDGYVIVLPRPEDLRQ